MRCTGHCCKRFRVADYTSLQVAYWKEHGHEYDSPIKPDTQQVIDMIIDLGVPPTEDDDRAVFNCSNLDAATGDCKIYETRPKMCRSYPNGKPCRFEGCTLDRM